MPSTDIDGSAIVILSVDEATLVYNYLLERHSFNNTETKLADKLAVILRCPIIKRIQREEKK